MLTLTENASTIINGITTQLPDANGLRIASGEGTPDFDVAPAAQAEPGDQVVEQDGATVYLNEPASAQLDDKVLDAGVDESGNVSFAIGLQG
jgi:Fe-S cluster assembly iron-binding protein IscA